MLIRVYLLVLLRLLAGRIPKNISLCSATRTPTLGGAGAERTLPLRIGRPTKVVRAKDEPLASFRTATAAKGSRVALFERVFGDPLAPLPVPLFSLVCWGVCRARPAAAIGARGQPASSGGLPSVPARSSTRYVFLTRRGIRVPFGLFTSYIGLSGLAGEREDAQERPTKELRSPHAQRGGSRRRTAPPTPAHDRLRGQSNAATRMPSLLTEGVRSGQRQRQPWVSARLRHPAHADSQRVSELQ